MRDSDSGDMKKTGLGRMLTPDLSWEFRKWVSPTMEDWSLMAIKRWVHEKSNLGLPYFSRVDI